MVVNVKRGMAGTEGTPKYGAAKSFKEAWLSDKGVSQNATSQPNRLIFKAENGRWNAAVARGR